MMHAYYISLSDFHWVVIRDKTYITHERLNSCLIWLFTVSPSPHVLCTLFTSVSNYPLSPFKCLDGRTIICNVFELHSIFSKQMSIRGQNYSTDATLTLTMFLNLMV